MRQICPVPLTKCACMMSSLLFAVFVIYLQRVFFCLQCFFFVCSVSFLFVVCSLWAIVDICPPQALLVLSLLPYDELKLNHQYLISINMGSYSWF